jgi:hypothetical protein
MFTLPSTPHLSSSSSSSPRSSIHQNDKTIFNVENQIISTHRTSSSSSFLQETKQLLEIISSNQNFDSAKIASEI